MMVALNIKQPRLDTREYKTLSEKHFIWYLAIQVEREKVSGREWEEVGRKPILTQNSHWGVKNKALG